jgi:hypothetical protein
VSPEEIRRRLEILLAKLTEQLEAIAMEAGEKRSAAIAASGLPPGLVAQILGADSELPRAPESATIRNMPQVHSATAGKKPAKRRKNGKESAVYFDPEKLARELGFADLNELAKKLGQTPATARSWRSRGYMPPRLHPQIEALKLLRATRKQ